MSLRESLFKFFRIPNSVIF